MSARIAHLERLLGRVVHDRAGRKIGRLHEAVAEERGGHLVITEYHIGTWGWLERFSLSRLWRTPGASGYRARWDQLHIGRERLALDCETDELVRVERGRPRAPRR